MAGGSGGLAGAALTAVGRGVLTRTNNCQAGWVQRTRTVWALAKGKSMANGTLQACTCKRASSGTKLTCSGLSAWVLATQVRTANCRAFMGVAAVTPGAT